MNAPRRFLQTLSALALVLMIPCAGWGQIIKQNSKYANEDKFRQLEELLPTANSYRSASGAPGDAYWQQRANYEIDVALDEGQRMLRGKEKITYYNNSPDELSYLWLLLEQNRFKHESAEVLSAEAPALQRVEFESLESLLERHGFSGGFEIRKVNLESGDNLPFTVVDTNMRIDLPTPLKKGESLSFYVEWSFKLIDAKKVRGRNGYEFFEKDGNCIFEIAQWFPRMAAYTDATGWQHKIYLGTGEFTLEFGDYLVRITTPEDHVVASTGVLMNGDQVLSKEQRERLIHAETAKAPVFIVTPDEAKANEGRKPAGEKTWIFKADNVRDFAFASSRKFIWDALKHDVEGNRVMAMSYYPKEAEPLWSKYSTHSIIHTLNTYSRYTFAYPYPTAISVNGPIYGMEYPMICFNGPRPEEDGTYTDVTKYGLISVIIHEVGHNYFPMIVNSDEREWMWMDEGLNTFLQYLAEQEWEEDYPSRRGEPRDIVEYMQSPNQVPIMTSADSLLKVGPNAYSKAATALNILRETVLGRELFDFSFKEYARRWKFKRPMPADLFRTMEDASGKDLDWFWRGWFYTTDHADISLDNLTVFTAKSGDPDIDKKKDKEERDSKPKSLSKERNKPLSKRVDQYPELKDFYNAYDELDVTEDDRKEFQKLLDGLKDNEKRLLKTDLFFHVLELSNQGGLVMPVILQLRFADNSTEEVRIPAQIWRYNGERIRKLLIREKEIVEVTLDPHGEIADADESDNHFPRKPIKTRFELFKEEEKKNAMQKAGLGKADSKQENKEGQEGNAFQQKETPPNPEDASLKKQ